MNILSSFDYFNVLYEVETSGLCCVPLNSVHHNFAVFISPEKYQSLNKIGFIINKENKNILNLSNDEFRKLVCSDRVIRVYSKSEDSIKTIMYIINSSFYTRRLGETLD